MSLVNWRRRSRKSDVSEVSDEWFASHVDAAQQVVDFLADAGLSLTDKRVGDVGTGDGIIALALALSARPEQYVGWDVNPVDSSGLRGRAQAEGYCQELPANLQFDVCRPTTLPAPDESFDALITWSAFEHIADIGAVASEMSRVLRPDGFVFAQVWPLYFSERGSHLWQWNPEGFHHLHQSMDDMRAQIDAGPGDEEWKQYMWSEYRSLNQATLDDVQHAFLQAGLIVRRCELYSHLVNIPEAVAVNQKLSSLMIAGFKMILSRQTEPNTR
jgi:ubiquinone/menaquinone biosynthesis C-methylase UbiE